MNCKILKKVCKRSITLCLLLFHCQNYIYAWGFLAHRKINRYAITTLPPAMFTFYKYHIHFVTENAVNPDKRRYTVAGEASKHYIDMEFYKKEAHLLDSYSWEQVCKIYKKETLELHGTLPWSILHVKNQLTKAFKKKDIINIIKLSADIGHYIADAHVPLHTTENYNGQQTNQEGIHALWETRLPELFIENYNFFVGPATYITNPQQKIWQIIQESHTATTDLLYYESMLNKSYTSIKKYSFEQQENNLKKVYSIEYATLYHTLLKGQVEKRMRAAIQLIGSFWLTCWIDAEKPDLDSLINIPIPETQLQETFPIGSPLLQARVCASH